MSILRLVWVNPAGVGDSGDQYMIEVYANICEKVMRRVAVAVSGGVDSSVSAYLLKKQGFDVSGVFITIWTPPHIPCSVREDRRSAMRACASLGIPFLEYDATEVYEEQVIKPFVEAYRRGETPNPDVLCNTHIKFGALNSFVATKGFSHLATGHYARIKNIGGHLRLFQSADTDKDQTYFIYGIPQKVLEKTLFPVGEYTKSKVRLIAERASLPAAGKKDSTGLCFLGAVSMKEFLSYYIKPKQGGVFLKGSSGKEVKQIGTHDGVWFYTLGQRHGFASDSGGPYIVVGKDIANNALFVSPATHSGKQSTGRNRFTLDEVLLRNDPSGYLLARYRHRGDLYPVAYSVAEDGSVSISFADPQIIAPGQSIVLYTEKGECLGGGVCQNGTPTD